MFARGWGSLLGRSLLTLSRKALHGVVRSIRGAESETQVCRTGVGSKPTLSTAAALLGGSLGGRKVPLHVPAAMVLVVLTCASSPAQAAFSTFAQCLGGVSGSGPTYAECEDSRFVNLSGGFSLFARAQADLARGELKAYASGGPESTATAAASLRDTVQFQGITAPTLIRAAMAVDGFFDVSNIQDTGCQSISLVVQTGFRDSAFANLCFENGQIKLIDVSEGGGVIDVISLTNLDVQLLFAVDFMAMPSASYALTASLVVSTPLPVFGTRSFPVTDFFNTARLAFDLPPGVTLVSESGVLLTEPSNPPGTVPVPPTALLLGAALAALGIVRRRDRRLSGRMH